MASIFTGIISGNIYDLRFASSGKLVSVRKKIGDAVKQWETIAIFDHKPFQTELDRQLADYEKVRAEFELFVLKHGKENADDTVKFLRQQKQSELNASVKEVEIAKYKLDQVDLVSPVEGFIIAMDGIVPGLHITPASNTVQILQTGSFIFSFDIEQEQLHLLVNPATIEITFPHAEKKYEAKTIVPIIGKKGIFTINAPLSNTTGLIVGMRGKARLI